MAQSTLHKPSEILNGLCKPILQWHLRFPTQQFLGQRDIQFPALGIIGGYRAIDKFRLGFWNLTQGFLRQLLDRVRPRIPCIYHRRAKLVLFRIRV